MSVESRVCIRLEYSIVESEASDSNESVSTLQVGWNGILNYHQQFLK